MPYTPKRPIPPVSTIRRDVAGHRVRLGQVARSGFDLKTAPIDRLSDKALAALSSDELASASWAQLGGLTTGASDMLRRAHVKVGQIATELGSGDLTPQGQRARSASLSTQARAENAKWRRDWMQLAQETHRRFDETMDKIEAVNLKDAGTPQLRGEIRARLLGMGKLERYQHVSAAFKGNAPDDRAIVAAVLELPSALSGQDFFMDEAVRLQAIDQQREIRQPALVARAEVFANVRDAILYVLVETECCIEASLDPAGFRPNAAAERMEKELGIVPTIREDIDTIDERAQLLKAELELKQQQEAQQLAYEREEKQRAVSDAGAA